MTAYNSVGGIFDNVTVIWCLATYITNVHLFYIKCHILGILSCLIHFFVRLLTELKQYLKIEIGPESPINIDYFLKLSARTSSFEPATYL
jgi:hypothetical protein